MHPFEYKPPRIRTGDLRTPIKFYEYVPNEGPEPGEQEEKVLYECMAKIDEVWLKDLELAKSTGTLSDVTITIRDPHGEFYPTEKHYISIDAPEYRDKRYNVKHVQPDLQNKKFITVIGRWIK